MLRVNQSNGFNAAARPKFLGADFNGSTQYLTRGENPTGIANGKQGTISVWFRLDGADGSLIYFLARAATEFVVRRNAANTIAIQGGSGGGTRVHIATVATFTAGATWYHLLASWDVATAGARHLYISDVSDNNVITFSDGSIPYEGDYGIGGTTAGANLFNGCMAELFFHTSYIDLSVTANRRKFITSQGKPADMGKNGTRPFGGVKPLLYHSVRRGESAAAVFALNRGSGGDFTGTDPTTSSTNP